MDSQVVAVAVESPRPNMYGDIILWELPVQIAASFFLGEGDDVLDVGGNTGGVAIAFSRLGGARTRDFV